MPRRLPQQIEVILAKARESCLAAVAAYNNPTTEFRSGSYVVLMIIAWTALFHAIFYRRRIKPWRIRSGQGKGRRYDHVDGDYRHWGLAECLNEYYGSNWNAIRSNLQFLEGLRDRIEHRSVPELDHNVFGECQASLINFEELLEDEFGEKFALNASLSFSLQMSGLVPRHRLEAMERLRRSASSSVVDYVKRFRNELAPEIASDQQCAFKVFVLPQLANHRSSTTLLLEYLPIDLVDDQARAALDRAIALVRRRNVATRDLEHLPRDVVDKVAARIPWQFDFYEHTRCWKHFDVRPETSAGDPSKTDDQFCIWDPTFKRHVFTNGWVQKLIQELKDPVRFQEIVGRSPVPSPEEPPSAN